MNICHINFAKGFRGGERQTALLIKTLANHPLEQILLARADSPLQDFVSNTPNLKIIPATKPYFKHARELSALNTNILHAHDAKGAQFSLLNYCLRKTPYVITRRMDRPPKNIWFTRKVYQHASRVVALSTAVKKALLTIKPNLSVDVIPDMYSTYNIDINKLAILKEKYKNNFIVGHIGALVDYHKGQSVLIDAARTLTTTHPNIKFLLLGDGKDEIMLKDLAKDLNNVEFIGFTKDVGTWINLFDLFVFPSLQEGMGSSLLDIMKAGKPIVASQVGGIVDIITDRENGLLSPTGDSAILADRIKEMYEDESLRQNLAKTASTTIENYSPEQLANQYFKLYQSIIQNETK